MRQFGFRLLLFLTICLIVQSGRAQTDSLNISWDRNPTEDSVAYYIIYRARTMNSDTNITASRYQQIGNFPQTLPGIDRVQAVDKSDSIQAGYFISYKVVAVDEQGLHSEFSDPEGVGLPRIIWLLTVIDSGQTTTVPLSEFLSDLDHTVSQLILNVSQISHLQVNRQGDNLNIIPDPLYSGLANFTLIATDPDGFWDRKTINLNVIATGSPNEKPKAENDQVSTRQGTAVIINPLINDTDPDGDPLLLNSTFPVQPEHGSLEILEDSLIRYTPVEEYHGLDDFDYEVTDGRGGRDTATVNITVLAVEVLGENTIVYPNPLKLSSGQSTIIFEPIPAEAQELWLISPALGTIVYKEIFNGAPPSRLELSLQDKNLKELASGFYIYLIKGKGDKKLKSGKIAIIR